MSLESLRAAIGVLFQDSLLFNRSIRDNLRNGHPETPEGSDEEARLCAPERVLGLGQQPSRAAAAVEHTALEVTKHARRNPEAAH